MMQAARDLIISKEVGRMKRDRNLGVLNENSNKRKRQGSALSLRSSDRKRYRSNSE
jgi:hypothetical protein